MSLTVEWNGTVQPTNVSIDKADRQISGLLTNLLQKNKLHEVRATEGRVFLVRYEAGICIFHAQLFRIHGE
jgi:hypothetical protein